MKCISHCKSRVGYEAIRRRNELSFIITSSEFHHAPFDVYSRTSSLGIEKVRSDTNNADSTECYRDRKFNHRDSTTRSLVFKLRTLPRARQGVWYHWHRCINARRARTHARIARARTHACIRRCVACVCTRKTRVPTVHANKYAMRGNGVQGEDAEGEEERRGSADLPAGCNNRPSVVAMVTPSIP